jgi:hypothetical protein
MQQLVKEAFLQAFNPANPMDEQYFTDKDKYHEEPCFTYACKSDGIVVKTHAGYVGNYQCAFHSVFLEDYFLRDTHEFVELHTSDDWRQLGDWEKQDKWATELRAHLEQIVNTHKVA